MDNSESEYIEQIRNLLSSVKVGFRIWLPNHTIDFFTYTKKITVWLNLDKAVMKKGKNGKLQYSDRYSLDELPLLCKQLNLDLKFIASELERRILITL